MPGLISVDVLVNHIRNGIPCKMFMARDVNAAMKRMGMLIEEIEKQPVVDPIVHGRWIGLEYDGYADGFPVWDKFECSVCGNEINTEDPPRYCCDCGADMDYIAWSEMDDDETD